jgi:hypothetical protein
VRLVDVPALEAASRWSWTAIRFCIRAPKSTAGQPEQLTARSLDCSSSGDFTGLFQCRADLKSFIEAEPAAV